MIQLLLGYNTGPDQLPNPYLITGPLHVENQREIMQNWGLLFDGKVQRKYIWCWC